MIPFASTLVTRVRTLTCAVLTSQYKQTPFKTLSLLRFVFMNRFPGHKLYMQGILLTNEVCGEILGQNFVYQTQMTSNKRPLCFLFREKSAWFVSCLLFFCFTSSVSSKRGKCQILVVWGKHASLRHYWNQSWCCLKLQELKKHQLTDPHGEKKKNTKRKTPSS